MVCRYDGSEYAELLVFEYFATREYSTRCKEKSFMVLFSLITSSVLVLQQ
jgi:hypothetical protein